MKHKQDWSNITGPVTIKTRDGGYFRPYKNIEIFCRHINLSFIENLGKWYGGIGTRVSYWNGDFYYYTYFVVDQDNLPIPKEVLKRIYCEIVPKYRFRWGRFHYNPETDFRNGPLGRPYYKGNGTRRSESGGGYTQKRYRNIATRRADASMFYDEDCVEYDIKPRFKALLPSPYDNEGSTRQGNNWKRFRKTQYREKVNGDD